MEEWRVSGQREGEGWVMEVWVVDGQGVAKLRWGWLVDGLVEGFLKNL